MAWFALFLTTLLGVAGFSLDLGNWYLNVQRIQRAADAAALAGDAYLPKDPGAAIQAAKDSLKQNGVTDAEVAASNIGPDPSKSTQMNVKVGITVRNNFLTFIGVQKNSRFVRGATAEHLPQLHINSGMNGLGGPEIASAQSPGCAPTTCWMPPEAAGSNYFLGMVGTDTNKLEGDRFTATNCAINGPALPVSSGAGLYWPTNCSKNGATGINLERADKPEDKQNFTIKLNPVVGGSTSTWLIIQAYDPEFNPNGGCSIYSGVHPECPADETYTDVFNWPKSVIGPGGNEPWSYYDLFTAPDSSVRNAAATCRNAANGFAPVLFKNDPNNIRFPTWQEVCRIRVDSTKAQSLTLRTWMGAGVGTNHYLLRASYSSSGGAPTASEVALSRDNINVSAYKNFSLHVSVRGGAAKFRLAQVGSEWAGRQIKLEVYDVADNYTCCKTYSGNGKNYYYGIAAGSISLSGDVNGPANYLAGNCYYTPPPNGPDGPTVSAPVNGCGMYVDQPHFKGQAVSLIWNVPSSYRCTPAGRNNCWLYLSADYATTGLVDDDSTWTMWQPGKPLRLVK